jgi:hypothetical protein
VGDSALNVASISAKISEDVEKADNNFRDLMKEWHFVHNLLDGVPSTIIQLIERLKQKYTQYQIGLFGFEWFVDKIFGLDEPNIVEFLGPAATSEQTHGLNIEEIRDLLANLTAGIQDAPIDEGNPRPVPVDKLNFNRIAGHWRAFIRAGTSNAGYVGEYFERHREPEFGKLVAKIFKDEYKALKTQGLAPDRIMAELYMKTAGVGIVPPERQVAIQALFAYLFDSCDIFEDKPGEMGQ